MEKDIPWRTNQIIGVSMLILDKVDFREKKMIIDKEGNYVIIKGLTHHEDVTALSVYAPNNTASKHTEQKS